jgi:hypothetical protein
MNRGGHDNQRRIGSLAMAALLVVAFLFLASSCGQSTSSAKQPTTSVAPSPPPGRPVPAQLLGDWFLSNGYCPLIKLTLAATTYHLAHYGDSSSGEVVVNNTEIDFFNAMPCGLQLPDGVGRHMWTLTGGVLHLTPLNQDPCPRGAFWLANQSYSRTR